MLCAWYVSSSERGKVNLIDLLMQETGMGPVACERYVRHAEKVIRKRAIFVGLLEPR